jgi:carboxylesterase type B
LNSCPGLLLIDLAKGSNIICYYFVYDVAKGGQQRERSWGTSLKAARSASANEKGLASGIRNIAQSLGICKKDCPSIRKTNISFRTLFLNNWYPQFKRIAAILGDLSFTLTRRSLLSLANTVKPNIPSWSYLSSYDYGTPVMGTFHGSDILQVFFGILPNYASASFHAYYLSFVNTLDPNDGTGKEYLNWSRWSTSNQLLNSYATISVLLADNFRQDTYDFILNNIANLHI